MYNIYSIVILILFDIPRFSVNDLHQIQVAAPSPSSRKLVLIKRDTLVHQLDALTVLLDSILNLYTTVVCQYGHCILCCCLL